MSIVAPLHVYTCRGINGSMYMCVDTVTPEEHHVMLSLLCSLL